MDVKLVTVATFFEAPQARIAQNVLKEAGIRAVLTDESVVAMDWLLGNAVGGIKVQVLEPDADRAVSVLERELGDDSEQQEIDEEELAAEAEAAEPEEPIMKPVPAAATDAESAYREGCARKLLLVAWIGLAIPPVIFYALYLFLNATFGGGDLSARGRFNLLVGGFVTFLELIFWFFAGPFLFATFN